jgi:hypothetical protein
MDKASLHKLRLVKPVFFVAALVFLGVAVLSVRGCTDTVAPKRVVVWNLSNGRSKAALEGGAWVGAQPRPTDQGDVYYIKGDRSLSVSVISSDRQQFDFDSVAHAYVTGRGDKVRTVDIASFGYSEQEVVQRLTEMNKQWNGMGVGEIGQWRSQVAKQYLGEYITVIHKTIGPEDPSITASIHYNFGNVDDAWFIMVTFFWNTP